MTAPDSDEESVHSIYADDIASPIDIDLSSYDELYKGFTPSSSSARTPYSLIKTKSNLDVFLDALVESGYANLDTSMDHAPEGGTGLTELVNDHFFKSAHHDNTSSSVSPVQRNLDSDILSSLPGDNAGLKRTGSIRVMYDLTRESLRANWDLEDESDTTTPRESSLKTSPMRVNNNVTERHISFPDLDSVDTESVASTPIQTENTITTPTKAAKNGEVDLRVHGDFNVWSGGYMLSSEYIQQEYVGLHPTALSHYLEDGKLVLSTAQSSTLSTGNSAVVSASAGASSGVNQVLSTATASLKFNEYSNSGSTFALPSDTNARGYYNLHVMECVLRPDVEAKIIMAIVVKMAKERNFKCSLLQLNHAVITLKRNHPIPNISKTGDVQGKALREWDQIDVQICISRELRQRVLLIQFLKRISIFDGVGGLNLSGMIINQLTGPQVILPLQKCPMTKEFASKLKKQLIVQQLTLSTLYHVPITQVCALPKGMDTHFLAQLHSLVRDNMWNKLTVEFAEMDKHVKEQEEHVMLFVKTIEPVYKHYNMRIGDLIVSSPSSSSSTGGGGGLAELLDTAASKEKKELQKQSKHDSSGDMKVKMTSSSTSSSATAPVVSAPAVAGSKPETMTETATSNQQQQEQIQTNSTATVAATAPGTPVKDSSFASEGLTSPPPSASSTLAVATETPMKNLAKSHSITELSPTRERSLFNNTSNKHNNSKVDGMVFCLIMLDKCHQELQVRCDMEYAEKIERRHENTLLAVQDIVSHKKAVLTALVHNASEARQSSLMKTFIGNFTGVSLTRFDLQNAEHDDNDASKQRRSYTIAGAFPEDAAEDASSTSRRHSVDEIKPAALAPAINTSSSGGGFFSMFSSTAAASSSASAVNSSGAELAPAPAAGLFKSKENRKVMTPEQVHQRVRELNAIAEWTSSSTSSAFAEDELIAKQRKERHAERWRFVFDLPRAIVLYYFACIVNNQQGTVYITQHYVCIASSLLGFNAKKEVYLLSDLTDINLQQTINGQSQSKGSATAASSESMFVPKSMTLVFCNGEKEVVVSPLVVDCMRAKMMFMEIQSQFCA